MLYENLLDIIGNTPIVKINNIFDTDSHADVYLKLENFNPGGSVKDRAALGIIEKAEKEGKLKPGSTIIEPTSGNMGISLAFIGSLKGYKTIIVMPDTMSIERRNILKALNAELILTDGARGMKGAIEKAESLASKNKNYFMPEQFSNPANVEAHYETTGEEILRDLPDVDVFIAGVGSGGTLSGVGRRLKEHSLDIQVVAVEPLTSAVISGEKPGKHQIQGLGAGFIPDTLDMKVIDRIIPVSDNKAFEFVKLIARKCGLFLGVSTGANVAAAYEIAKNMEKGKKVLTIASDTGEKYLSLNIYK
ncbi:Cysteine synthase [Sebaldella termitidis]|uniref:Cysteine synthase n=1 Tax=Sebaldella termitidis (strain ATCC 33386 / NCTC 11300) TaxID=526218 RepID=D1AJZ8_SEBTE|nr:cysteine synthase A [Sebaldella termitidis]ACZ07055.1 cysteine synthase A [Sebaldella termitidis ATCC 33386]MBP7979361.1 cysteine synthase A [Sebaldella sp.]SUI22345.1 Cysteine synthase [Sebaldella termitidis]